MTALFDRQMTVTVAGQTVTSEDLDMKIMFPFAARGLSVATLIIKNPSDNIVAAFQVFPPPLVVVTAGFGLDVGVVSIGYCTRTAFNDREADVILTAKIVDQPETITSLVLNQSFKGQLASTIISSVASAAGIIVEKALPTIDIPIENFVVRNVIDALDELAQRTESIWYFRHGNLIVENPLLTDEPIPLNFESGLLLAPVINETEIYFESAFIHQIAIGKTVAITTEKGLIAAKVKSGEISFSNYDTDDGMKIEATLGKTRIKFDDMLKGVIEKYLNNVLVCYPSKVLAFDDTTNPPTATVQPLLTKLGKPFPPISGVPVAMDVGGGYFIKYKLQTGDLALVAFSSNSIGQSMSGIVTEESKKQFNAGDCFVVRPLVSKTTPPLPGAPTDGIVIGNQATGHYMSQDMAGFKFFFSPTNFTTITPAGVSSTVGGVMNTVSGHIHLETGASTNPPTPGT